MKKTKPRDYYTAGESLLRLICDKASDATLGEMLGIARRHGTPRQFAAFVTFVRGVWTSNAFTEPWQLEPLQSPNETPAK